jgi:hypothetical protein
MFADAANYAGRLDASSRTEVRARVAEGDPASPAADLVEILSARLRLSDRVWDHSVSYTPVLTAPGLFQSGSQALLLHAGAATTEWHDRRVRIALTESANYGSQNAALLTTVVPGADGRPPPAQIASAPLTLRYGLTRTNLATDLLLDRRTRATMAVSYVLQGGLDDASRTLFPLQRGPRVEGTLGWSASRTDVAETRGLGQLSESSSGSCPLVVTQDPTAVCDPAAQIAVGLESWRHRFSREVEGSLGAGVALARTRVHAADPFTQRITPAIEAWIQRTHGTQERPGTLRLDAQLEPIVDLRSGTSDYRAQVSALATVPMGDTTIRGQLWGAQSVETVLAPRLTLLRAEVEVEHHLSPIVSLGVGARAEWEHQAPLGSFESAVLFGQATFRAPTMRF